MNICAEMFIAKLKTKDLNYSVRERDSDVIVTFPYDNRKTNIVFSGEDGAHAQLATVIESVPEDKFVDVVLACNSLNATFRYVKFAVDKDNDVMAYTDAILDPASADEECFELLVRSLKIIGEAKPPIMKAIYA